MTTNFDSIPLNSEKAANSELLEQPADTTPPVEDTTLVDNAGSIEPTTSEQSVDSAPPVEDAITDGTGSVVPIAPVEPDPLDGFDPADYGDGVEGDERYRIMELNLAYLIRNRKDIRFDKVKLRMEIDWWDQKNRPPLGTMEIWSYVKANYDHAFQCNRPYFKY